jgi:eukaryotic-like serine/threonine-protein kinase
MEMSGACPNENLLVEYVDRRLGTDAEAELERHFDSCPDCTALLAGLASSCATLGGPAHDDVAIRPGAHIDRYVVRERIGAGAMGVVYEAFDPELDRRVALKLVRAVGRHADPRDRGRMLREAQAMARLSHPNVVPVLAVGTRGDDLWLVMELVEGTTLREWLAVESRSWRTIVRAYADCGRALAAAHAAGVVHRDFKPDNVLIASDGRVRVIDFGLARLVASARAEIETSVPGSAAELERTAAGLVIGTPAYMPPEQLLDAAVDARADQFALAVSLWEGLFGVRPFVGETLAALVESVEERRFRTTRVGARVPARLRKALMRALAARPRDRFADTDALVRELERSLAGGVRNVLIAGVLATSAVAVAFGVPREKECVPDPAPQWDAESRALVQDAFDRVGLPMSGASGTVADAIQRRVDAWHETHAQICATSGDETRTAAHVCLDVRRLELDAAIEVIGDGDPDVVRRAVDVVVAMPAVEPCANTDDPRLALVDPAALVQEARTLRADLAHAGAIGQAGRYDDGIALARRTHARADAMGYAALRAEAAHRVGDLLIDAGRPVEAVEWLERAFFEAREIGHDEVATDAALGLVDAIGARQARTDAAEPWVEHASAALERWGSADREAIFARLRGGLAARRSEPDLAIAEYERAVELWTAIVSGPDPRLASAIDSIGSVYWGQRDFETALRYHSEALAMREALFGDQHPAIGNSINNVALDLLELDQPEAAIHHYEWAIEINYAALGPQHLMYGNAHNNLGAAYGRLDEPWAAAREFEAALPGYEGLGPNHPDTAALLRNYGTASLASDDLVTAIEMLSRAHTINEHHFGPDSTQALGSAAMLGRVSTRIGAHRRAIELLERVLGSSTPLYGHSVTAVAALWIDLGRSRLARGDVEGAESALATGRAVLERTGPPFARDVVADSAELERQLEISRSSASRR